MKRKMKWGREEQDRTEESGKRGGRAQRGETNGGEGVEGNEEMGWGGAR